MFSSGFFKGLYFSFPYSGFSSFFPLVAMYGIEWVSQGIRNGCSHLLLWFYRLYFWILWDEFIDHICLGGGFINISGLDKVYDLLVHGI